MTDAPPVLPTAQDVNPQPTARDWDELFTTLPDYMKAFATRQWPLMDDGSGSDVYVSLNRLYAAFPVPVDILLLDTKGIHSLRHPDRYATAIRYDFSRPNTRDVRFHGVVPLSDAESNAEKIRSILGIYEESLDSLKDLSLLFLWDLPLCTHIVPYDARAQLLDYCGDLARELSHSRELTDRFAPRIDYNAKYGLLPDPPLTDEQLLRPHELSSFFVEMPDGKPLSLAERHASVADIQLIPQVTEGVRRTFDLAKRLYIYGQLEYGFFTVSLHYAHLAVDAALHARWSATLPSSVVLTLHKKKKVEKQETMQYPSHVKIRNFCKLSDWRVSSVRVNGKPFPYTVTMVIEELAQKGLLSKWQRRMIQEVDIEIRNSLTHLEFAPIHVPSEHDLELAAKTINGLFDSLPIPSPNRHP